MRSRVYDKMSPAFVVAVEAVEAAERELEHAPEPDVVYRKLERTLDSRLGNVGLSADFVNKAYYLSDTSKAERSRFGVVIPKKGMLLLFQENDDPGEYSIIRMEDDEGHVEEEAVATGKVKNGQLSAALREIGSRSPRGKS